MPKNSPQSGVVAGWGYNATGINSFGLSIALLFLTCTLSSQFPKGSMDRGHSQLTVQEVHLKVNIKKKPLQAVSPLMGSSGGIETKQKQNSKTSQGTSHVAGDIALFPVDQTRIIKSFIILTVRR